MKHSESTLLRRARLAWRRRGARHVLARIAVARQRLALVGGAILLGVVALLFARCSDVAQGYFAAHLRRHALVTLTFTPLMFLLVAWVTRRWTPEARGSGIPQVIAAGHAVDRAAKGPLVSLRTALAKFVLTVGVLLAGGSAGREGPTVQISAAIMVAVHRLSRVPISAGVLLAGGAAGVAAAFNTPLAGVAFAIEELAAAYEQKVALLVMAAVMISGMVSLGIAGDYVYFGTMGDTISMRGMLLAAPLLGVAGGLTGGAFARLLLLATHSERPTVQCLRRHPYRLALGCGVLVAVIGIASGDTTWGTGYAATRALVEGRDASLWFGPGKFIATLATAVSGVPGGIFAPSLSVGAGLGRLFVEFFPTQPPGTIIVLAMVAYFVGAVRSPLTAVVIVSETTASHGLMLSLFATALIADAASSMVCKHRLYHGLSRQFLPGV